MCSMSVSATVWNVPGEQHVNSYITRYLWTYLNNGMYLLIDKWRMYCLIGLYHIWTWNVLLILTIALFALFASILKTDCVSETGERTMYCWIRLHQSLHRWYRQMNVLLTVSPESNLYIDCISDTGKWTLYCMICL